jgi:hypothetical protein
VHRTGKPQLYLEHVGASTRSHSPTRSHPIRPYPRRQPKRIRGYAHSGIIHATNSLLQPKAAMRFVGRAGSWPTPVQSWPNLSKTGQRGLSPALLSFSTRTPWSHCPFLQASLPSFALLALLAHCNFHSLLVTARCRRSLRHKPTAGLSLRSLTDCFYSPPPFIQRCPSPAASQYHHQQ